MPSKKCDVVIRSRHSPAPKFDSSEDSSCIGPVAGSIRRRGSNVLPLVWCESLERRVPAQVSSSSSDSGSNLRGPSQNSSRLGSKRDVNPPRMA
ncbi:hypothetical protein AVEN_221012-1 [Araneus ventricosus]|uniref:Uncharacterized protein n=1 Tax=Araneus ventricosus TaxID=182803 RepID=A0A4Y2Q7U7_ARAVE|nr:hypothetical protein AVEN_221012-1 [Araneus ventricosus]